MQIDIVAMCPLCDTSLYNGVAEVVTQTPFGTVHRLCELEQRVQELERLIKTMKNQVADLNYAIR